jgi:hypothetical protein
MSNQNRKNNFESITFAFYKAKYNIQESKKIFDGLPCINLHS